MQEAGVTRTASDERLPIPLPSRHLVPEVFLLSWKEFKRSRRDTQEQAAATPTSDTIVMHNTHGVRVKTEPRDDSSPLAQEAVSETLPPFMLFFSLLG